MFGRIQGRGKSGRQKYFRLELLLLPCANFTLVYFKACIRITLVMGLCVLGPGIVRPHQKNTHQVKSSGSPIGSAGRKL